MPDVAFTAVHGIQTGGKVKVLDATGTWLRTVNHYDEKHRVVKIVSENNKSGYDKTSTIFEFTGRPLKVFSEHIATVAGTTVTKTISRKFMYDHAGRIEQLWHSVDGAPDILLTASEYNEIGQLIDKRLHSQSATAQEKQSVDYRYNIRGWLTNINDASLNNDEINPDENLQQDLFGMNLEYTTGEPLALTPLVDSLESSNVSVFNVDGNANDEGPANRDGTIVGATATPNRNGEAGKALLFNGSNQCVNLTSSEATYSFIQNTGVFTITAYIKLNDLAKRSVIIGSSGGSVLKGFTFMYENLSEATGIHALRFITSSGVSGKGAKYTINDNNWHHVAVVGDGNSIRFYVDGIPDGEGGVMTKLSSGSSTNPIQIGATFDNAGARLNYMKGGIDELKIYDKALTLNEVKALASKSLGGSQYNGNISTIKSSNNLGTGDVKQKEYAFSYDPLNRLTDASFREGSLVGNTMAWATASTNKFIEGGITYDLNGNIKSLNRTDASGQTMDFLSYDYGTGSNKLLSVSDQGNDEAGFVEPGVTVPGADYSYDQNGNLIFDRNKGGKDVVNNGDFDEGSTGWSKSGGGVARLVFQDSVLSINNTSTSAAAIVQSGIIVPGKPYYAILEFERTSGSAGITVSVGGIQNTSLYTSSGQHVLYAENPTTTELRITVSGAAFVGKIKKIEVKAVTLISYNHLNLPKTVTKGDDAIQYIYDATGRKLAQIVTNKGAQKKRSDYAGEYFYENDTLKFINHEEGRIVMTGTPAYEYHLKDHLGNVRLTFTTKPDVENFLASMDEPQTGENDFLYYDEAVIINHPLFDRTHNNLPDNTPGITFNATRLSGGGTNEIYGLAKSLSVMPGDTIKMEVFAKYVDSNDTTWNVALTDLMSAIAQHTSSVFVDGGVAGSIGNQSFPYQGIIAKDDSDDDPKAYLNWIITDRNAVPIDMGYKRLSASQRENGTNVAHEMLEQQIVITDPGYVYIYLSNENETPVEVYFDDFRVEHVKSSVVQMDDYYPFGLTYNSYSRENTTPQDYKYNGKEEQTELNLGWLDYGQRMYQPELGRFFAQDRFAEKYYDHTPYGYALNNPALYIDINGDSVWTTHASAVDKNGNTTITHTVHVQGKVLNQSNGTTKAGDVARGLNGRLNAQGSTTTKTNDDGTTTTEIINFAADFTEAKSMADVSKTDHLVVMVDGVLGKGDPNLGGGDAVGLGSEPGQISYVESSGAVETAFHEVGHNLGLPHVKGANPMSYSGRGTKF